MKNIPTLKIRSSVNVVLTFWYNDLMVKWQERSERNSIEVFKSGRKSI